MYKGCIPRTYLILLIHKLPQCLIILICKFATVDVFFLYKVIITRPVVSTCKYSRYANSHLPMKQRKRTQKALKLERLWLYFLAGSYVIKERKSNESLCKE